MTKSASEEQAEKQAAEWLEEAYPTHRRQKYGTGPFDEHHMESAFMAGFVAGMNSRSVPS